MQKALTQMNVQLANVISDVVGETGQKILRAILAGERDGHVLAEMKNARIRASVDEIAKSLQGNWRAEHLFALKQAVDAFDFIGTQLAECDREIEQQLQRLQTREGEPARGKQRGRARNAPKFDLRTQLFRMCGVDLTRIDGIDVTTALAVISEIGTDMSRFPSAAHFASWLGLCPGTRITGGKVMSGKTKRCANHAAQALRLAAAALRTSQSALGAYFRRMCSRMDKPKAVTATAHKLA
ncbi:transposase, partial [Paraburkholderia aspalathi]